MQVEVADALKMAAMVGVFRGRGHLAAQLDPLGRAPRGPWLSEAAERTTSAGLYVLSPSPLLCYHSAPYLR